LLGVSALVLLGRTSQNPEEFGHLHDLLLVFNAVGACILLLLIVGNIVRLVRDRWHGVPGAKLKARMVVAIVGLVVAPLVVVYLFAIQFLNRGIDTWFDVEIESGLNDALTLSRAALDRRIYTSMERTRQMANSLMRSEGGDLVAALGELRRDAGAIDVTVYGRNYLIVATSHQDLAAPFPAPPPEDVVLQLRQSGTYVGIAPVGNGNYQVRAALLLPSARLGRSRSSCRPSIRSPSASACSSIRTKPPIHVITNWFICVAR